MLNLGTLLMLAFRKMLYNSCKMGEKSFISPEILISKSNPSPNLYPKKANKKSADEYFSFLLYFL